MLSMRYICSLNQFCAKARLCTLTMEKRPSSLNPTSREMYDVINSARSLGEQCQSSPDSSNAFPGLRDTCTGSLGWLRVLSCHTWGFASSFRGRWAKIWVLAWQLGRTKLVFPSPKSPTEDAVVRAWMASLWL